MRDLYRGPLPGPAFGQQVSSQVDPPIAVGHSGEITTNKDNISIYAPRQAGRVANAYLSVGASGKDDSNTLSLELDVKINGTSVFTTKPKIAHVSGEASQQKTTLVTGDTGITQAVMDTDNNDYSPGDLITYTYDLTRTASPTTEISAPVAVIELMPNQG